MTTSTPETAGFPNRNYLLLFLVNLVVSISFAMVSTTIALHLTEFGTPISVVGNVVGVLSIASLCIRPFTGWMSDRFSRKRLLCTAQCMIGLAIGGCALTQSIPLLILFRIMHGAAFSVATTVTMAMVAGTIPKARMTQGMAIFALGQTISIAIAPSIGMAIGGRFGYNITFGAAAILMLVAALLARIILPVEARAPKPAWSPPKPRNMIAREAVPYGIIAIVAAGTTGIENGYLAIYGAESGLGNIGWYFTISAAALLVSRVLGGRLADRHPHTAMYAGLGAMALAFVLIGLGGGALIVPALGMAAACKALGLGVVQPMLQAYCMRSVGNERRGAASSTYYLGTDIGQALMPMAGGYVAVTTGYRHMFLVFAAPLVLGAVFYFIVNARAKDREREPYKWGNIN